MNPNDIVLKVTDVLDRCKIPYMIVGSFSSNVYGIERTTVDADFVLQLGSHSMTTLARELGPDFAFDTQSGFETVTMTQRILATHRNPHFKIEMFLLSDDPHDQERFRRRLSGQIGQRVVYFPTPEDVIITKLNWHQRNRLRTKDLDDARNVLAVQQGRLDMPYIRKWCDVHDTRELLEQTLRDIPELPPH